MTGIKRLTPPQSRKVNSLIKKECCNCDNGHCILLDDGEECVCPQLISYSLLCKWFQTAVLPLDKLLYAELFKTEDKKRCTECGTSFASTSNSVKYCPDCRKRITRILLPFAGGVGVVEAEAEAYYPQTGSGAHEKTARPCYVVGAKKALIYGAFSA